MSIFDKSIEEIKKETRERFYAALSPEEAARARAADARWDRESDEFLKGERSFEDVSRLERERDEAKVTHDSHDDAEALANLNRFTEEQVHQQQMLQQQILHHHHGF